MKHVSVTYEKLRLTACCSEGISQWSLNNVPSQSCMKQYLIHIMYLNIVTPLTLFHPFYILNAIYVFLFYCLLFKLSKLKSILYISILIFFVNSKLLFQYFSSVNTSCSNYILENKFNPLYYSYRPFYHNNLYYFQMFSYRGGNLYTGCSIDVLVY